MTDVASNNLLDLTCPHCGYVNSRYYDFSVYGNNILGVMCSDCGKDFECERLITYSTYIAYEEGGM